MGIHESAKLVGEVPLNEKIINGVKWTALFAILGHFVSLVKTPILVRLLIPADFGLMGMLLTVMAFTSPITEMGIGSAIIQKQDISKIQLSTLYWLNILVGIVMFIFVISISPLIADFYDEQRLVDLLHLFAFMFLIIPLGSQFEKLMEKELNFGLPVQAKTAALFANFSISVTLALFGCGVYSLIYGRLGGSFISSFIFTTWGMKHHKPSLLFSIKESKSLLVFGAYQISERFIKILSTNIDKLFIGKFFGAEVLGYYTVAHALVIIPMMTLNPIITKVTFPVFSIIQKDIGKINEYFTLAIKVLLTLNFPIYGGLIMTSSIFVPIIFGEGWEPVVPVLQVLSLGALIWTISNPVGSVLLAKGRADVSFMLNLLRAVVLVGMLALAYWMGRSILSIAIGIVVSRYVTDPFIHLYMNKYFGINYREIIKHLMKVVSFTALMSLGVFSVGYLNLNNAILVLILKVFFGCFIYSALLVAFDTESFKLLRTFLKKQ